MTPVERARIAKAQEAATLTEQIAEGIAHMKQQLSGVRRCPHCSVANPMLVQLWMSNTFVPRATHGPTQLWAAYACTTCGGVVLARGRDNTKPNDPNNTPIAEIIPAAKQAHEDIPDVARNFLQQAYETLHAPDAAAVMAGSAVDAMLKECGLQKGSLYDRIDEAVEQQVLTKSMADWAHDVRLGSNRPRHADEKAPHISREEAAQSVEFAGALGFFLFVLNKRIERGKAAALATAQAGDAQAGSAQVGQP